MACPYFYPVARLEEDLWVVPPRLPLGDAYTGECRSGGISHQPEEAVMRTSCNSGYARGRCERFPQDARADAVRFSVAGDESNGIRLQYIFEKKGWPLDHGELRYSVSEHAFTTEPVDEVMARQAAAFVGSYLRRTR